MSEKIKSEKIKHFVIGIALFIFICMVGFNLINDPYLTVKNMILSFSSGLVTSWIFLILINFDKCCKWIESYISRRLGVSSDVLTGVLWLLLFIGFLCIIYALCRINISISDIVKTPTILEQYSSYAVNILILSYGNYLASWLINCLLENIKEKRNDNNES